MLDVRLAATLVVISVALGVLVLALWFKGRRWDEYVVGFIAVFGISLLVGVLVTNAIAAYPALSVETIFPVP